MHPLSGGSAIYRFINQRFISGVFTKDTSEDMGQARDTITHLIFNALNSTIPRS